MGCSFQVSMVHFLLPLIEFRVAVDEAEGGVVVEGEAGDDPDARGAVGVGATGPVELAIHRQEGALASDALDGGIAAQGEEGRVAEGAGVGVGGEEGIVEVADACVGRLRQGGLGRDLAVVAQLGEGQAAAVRVAHHGAAAFGQHLERRGHDAGILGRPLLDLVRRGVELAPCADPADLERVDHVGIAPHDGCQLPDVRQDAFGGRACAADAAELIGEAQQELHAILAGAGEIGLEGVDLLLRDFRFGKLQQVAVGLRHGDAVAGVAREGPRVAQVGAGHDIGGYLPDEDFKAEAPLGIAQPAAPVGIIGADAVEDGRFHVLAHGVSWR